ncbi:Nucleotide-binding alpha-beta plait [Penicillium bovifimosum]|uniref:Nucleotide-binding alpha-beta plait n=1 Tax=Penicillium bovifimosum TaxID=126998 RepID=A0A9W9LA21_9EURO|nr:Nucleotide-binding alpha-beta plait [Penicillium bovifimosum]KAJ5146064.1 Nucleotide-binding alpha-beta plait [Penicillium bovifimosum]
MNSIRQVQALNKRELEHAIPPEASWHADYRDTAYIYIGGLPFDLTEGDIIAIFSQYGEPVHVNLVRDKETGKSKGFAFLKYEDQRSTDLAVDNLGGATVMGRFLRVDHARYKRKDEEEEEDNVTKLMGDSAISKGKEVERKKDSDIEERRPLLKEEKELEDLIRNHDEEDPMKEFLIEEKKEEVARAIELLLGDAMIAESDPAGTIVGTGLVLLAIEDIEMSVRQIERDAPATDHLREEKSRDETDRKTGRPENHARQNPEDIMMSVHQIERDAPATNHLKEEKSRDETDHETDRPENHARLSPEDTGVIGTDMIVDVERSMLHIISSPIQGATCVPILSCDPGIFTKVKVSTQH